MSTDIGSKSINGYFKSIPEGVDPDIINNAKPIDVGSLSTPIDMSGGGIGDTYWSRNILGYLRPVTTLDRILLGGGAFTASEQLKVTNGIVTDTLISTTSLRSPSIIATLGANTATLTTDTASNLTFTFPVTSGRLALEGVVPTINWSAIVDKPTSSVTNIDLAVTNSHTHIDLSLLESYTNTNTNISAAIAAIHTPVTIGGGSSDVLTLAPSSQILSINYASLSNNGIIRASDYNIFYNKQNYLGFTPENIINKEQANGYAGLDSNGKIYPQRLPALAINNTYVVADEAAMLLLNANIGDIAKQTTPDPYEVYVLQALPASDIGNWVEITVSSDIVSINGYSSGVIVLAPVDVGAEPALGNPASSGYILSSTDVGVRSWIAFNGNAVYYEFDSGALTANIIKTVVHGQALTNYIIMVRNAANTNNAIVGVLMKNISDPTNAIDIKSSMSIGEPGLKIQIIGV
jgi:hypothetical protein